MATGAASWRLRAGLITAFALLVAGAAFQPGSSPFRALRMGSTAEATPTTLQPSTLRPTLPADTLHPGKITGPRASLDGCGFTLTPGAQVTPVGHCTVVEIGDSLGNDLGWGLQRHVTAASGLTLHQLDRSATGLANTSYYNWSTTLASAMVQYRPDVVLICLGGNDEQGFEVAGTAVHFGTSAWRTAYLARAQQLVQEATSAGAEVVWVGLPVMQDAGYGAGIETLNGIYQQAVDASPMGVYVGTWSLFAGPSGAFRSRGLVNGQPATLRQPDGIHLSLSGEDVVATYVLRTFAAAGHINLVPTDPAVITG